jgi:hypothetical protein
MPDDSSNGKNYTSTVFASELRSLEHRNRMQPSRWTSPLGTLLKDRASNSKTKFTDIMQADFLMYLHSQLHLRDQYVNYWWPATLVYSTSTEGQMTIFAKSASKKYLNQVLSMIGVSSVSDISSFLEVMKKDPRQLPSWNYHTLNPAMLIGLEKLGTKP